MLAEDELRDATLLVFANKQDLPNAMSAAELTDRLGLHNLRSRQVCLKKNSMKKSIYYKNIKEGLKINYSKAFNIFSLKIIFWHKK